MGFNLCLHLKTLRATTLKFTMPGNVKFICISVGLNYSMPYVANLKNTQNTQKTSNWNYLHHGMDLVHVVWQLLSVWFSTKYYKAHLKMPDKPWLITLEVQKDT